TLQQLVQQLGAPPLGVSLCSVMHSVLAVNQQGKALTPLVIWADNRSEAYAAQLKGTPLGKAIYRHTGTPIHPMSPLCKLAWWRDHEPDVFRQAHKFVCIKEYLLFHLFGRWVIDYSVASATGLFDKETLDWYAPALEFAGVKREQLSEAVPPSLVLNHLNPVIAERLNLPIDTPFVMGASDGALANLGALVLEPGQVTITLGTSAAIRTTGKMATYDEAERLFSYVIQPDFYITGGASNNGGIVYQWFTEQFFDPIPSKEQALERIGDIAQVPAGADGLLFVPYLTGERAPVWDAHARGIFYGVTKAHTRLHFQRAVLEGILYNVRQIGKALEDVTGEAQSICVNGGLAEVDAVMQLLADIFGKPVHRLDCEEGSAFGAFILGMQALGQIETFAEAKQWVNVAQTYEPNLAAQAIHQAQFAIFEKLYPILKDVAVER
ncbi:MAG: gluconokinase, partial [Saprospiraceae bacterium]